MWRENRKYYGTTAWYRARGLGVRVRAGGGTLGGHGVGDGVTVRVRSVLEQRACPHVILHKFVSLGNIFNILPYAQGSDLSCTCSNVTYHNFRSMIDHRLGRVM